ncbi:Uncharacterized protein dnm_061430 [Desulfonema magnum]|uniref:Uncharacterized protein n=1 Tax=Desulfonema magnum TaxID=45655 RepID=A0A975BQY7_9BACT|nr:Uncharacterized protein dnm_061430 [Desulfonema magnum]
MGGTAEKSGFFPGQSVTLRKNLGFFPVRPRGPENFFDLLTMKICQVSDESQEKFQNFPVFVVAANVSSPIFFI